MKKVIGYILVSIASGTIAAVAVIAFFESGASAGSLVVPTRADYVNLILTLVTILLGSIGLAVTVAALVIGFVAFKTMNEIKTDAAKGAATSAGEAIGELLPKELQRALKDSDVVMKSLRELSRKGELDQVVERVTYRVQDVASADAEAAKPEGEEGQEPYTDD